MATKKKMSRADAIALANSLANEIGVTDADRKKYAKKTKKKTATKKK